MTAFILPIRFDSIAHGPVSERVVQFYSTLAELFLSDTGPAEALDPYALSEFSNINLATIVVDLSERINFMKEGNSLVVDVGGPSYAHLCNVNVFMVILLFAQQFSERFPGSQLIIFVSQNHSDNDAGFRALVTGVARNKVKIILGNGTIVSEGLRENCQNQAEFNEAIASATAPVTERLKKKLIRRHGLFCFDRTARVSTQIYDGIHAENEILELLTARFGKFVWTGEEIIVSDFRSTSWFGRPLSFCVTQNTIPEGSVFDADELMSSDELLKSLSGKTCIVYLPIVRSGEFASAIFKRRSKYCEKLSFYALLSTMGSAPYDRAKILSAEVEGNRVDFKVQYDILVEPENGVVRQLFSGFEGAKIAIRRGASAFSASEFWAMVLEGGVSQEADVPPTRQSLGFVPRFGILGVKNAPLIAERIVNALREVFKVREEQRLLFLCPDEHNAKTVLRSLRELSGIGFLPVSKKVIGELYSGRSASADQLKSKLPADLVGQLGSVASNYGRADASFNGPGIIVFDEFLNSGASVLGMSKLAQIFDLNVIGQLVLANFGGDIKLEGNILALYDLDYTRWAGG